MIGVLEGGAGAVRWRWQFIIKIAVAYSFFLSRLVLSRFFAPILLAFGLVGFLKTALGWFFRGAVPFKRGIAGAYR